MPGLVAFNRRWGIGSDDLVIPSFFETCLRTSWLVAISVMFHIHHNSQTCADGGLLEAFYVGTLVLLVFGILNSASVMYFSKKGSITNTQPRRHIPKLVYIKFAILVPEVAWTIIGTYWAFGKSYGCESHLVWTVRGAVICAWCVGACIIIGILVVFDPLGARTPTTEGAGWKSHRVWETRCRLLFCCASCDQGNNDAFTDVAKLVADFFGGIDMVPTDVAAGLILVQRQQRLKEARLAAVLTDRQAPGSTRDVQVTVHGRQASSTIMTPISEPQPWMNIKQMANYMRFALASYGWPFFMYDNLTTGLCELLSKCRQGTPLCHLHRYMKPYLQRIIRVTRTSNRQKSYSLINYEEWLDFKEMRELDSEGLLPEELCCSCVRQGGKVFHDNSCECNVAAIKLLTGIQRQDLIYASFHNKWKEIPFYVAVDRSSRAVVVGIRGTLSLADALTDMSAVGESIEVPGLTNCYVHGGMLHCSAKIKKRLLEAQLLDRAFEALGEGHLVITGHSLGAGVATILAIELRQQYPDLMCFAFSPPGGLLSPNLATYTEDFVCSVVVGKDIIPRLSMPTMHTMKKEILTAIADCDLPKYRILASGLFRMFCGCLDSVEASEEEERHGRHLLASGTRNPNYSREESTVAPQNEHLRNIQEAISSSTEQTQDTWPMHMPGKVFHVIQAEENRFCGGDPDFYAVWAHPSDFGEILIGPRMVLDHFPDVVLRALQQLEKKNYVPRAHRLSDAVDC